MHVDTGCCNTACYFWRHCHCILGELFIGDIGFIDDEGTLMTKEVEDSTLDISRALSKVCPGGADYSTPRCATDDLSLDRPDP